MPLPMTAAVVRRAGAPFTLEAAEIDDPRPGEVLVRVAACGICHTDAVMRDQQAGFPPLPAVLGHEGSGVVVKAGEGVTGLAPGDPVIMSFHSCGRCPSCERREPAYCHEFAPRNVLGRRADGTSGIFAGGEPVSGNIFGQSSFATYALCHQDNAVKAPPGAPLELLGPLGCGIQTGAGAVLNTLKVGPGGSVLVLGAGAVGLSAAMAAKLAGAQTIAVVDRVASRLELALELGATHVVNGARERLDAALGAIRPQGFDHVVESTGAPALLADAVAQIGRRGALALLGAFPPNAALSVPITPFMAGGKSIRGVIEGDSQPQIFVPALIEHFLAGRFPFDRLIRLYDFADINQAMADSLDGTTVKPVLRMPAS